MLVSPEITQLYFKQAYRIVGKHKHAAVKICHWTKESLRWDRVCYKELWYPPVESHRCMEMTPYVGCNHHCLFCWRIHSGDRPNLRWKELPSADTKFDNPETIVTESIEARKQLLVGFKGNPLTDNRKYEKALKPTMMTMSLTGEPTLYPDLSGLISAAKKHGMVTFLVTNGTLPERLEEMDPLPFQLYVTLPAPDKKTYLKTTKPLIKNGWGKLNETLGLFPSLNTRKVIRLTLVKGLNMFDSEKYAKLIEKAEPDFVEPKGFMWVGEARNRLPKEAMPSHEEIKKFGKELSNYLGYEIVDEFKPSRVVLLKK